MWFLCCFNECLSIQVCVTVLCSLNYAVWGENAAEVLCFQARYTMLTGS